MADATVSKCYGSREKIKNPPKLGPDDLVMAYKDIRRLEISEADLGLLQYPRWSTL